ncbi:MAG: VOC family protein, partial [Chloroflexi bacterium]|nr:VOC family protein [Chloroflexota bacterium]
MTRFTLPAETHIEYVRLIVSDLDRALKFYGPVLGFKLLRHQDSTAWLGVDHTLLVKLIERPGARPKPPRTTGLFHFAILVPSRFDLARSYIQLMDMDYPLQGASDHLVSEALYLSDPDGNGIEIYADRPR